MFPTYGFLRGSYSLGKLGPGKLTLSAEAAVSLKELASPTSTTLNFNQIYDVLHGQAPDIPAAFKANIGLKYNF